MDLLQSTVLRLHEQGCSQREICDRAKISHTKATQILVTLGAIDTEESKLYLEGYTVQEIADALDKRPATVKTRIPYQKGMYNAQYPSKNALIIRKCRGRKETKHDD